MQGPSISINRLGLQYDNNVILEDISLELGSGECHVIMGPNGGGKTSLLRSVSWFNAF